MKSQLLQLFFSVCLCKHVVSFRFVVIQLREFQPIFLTIVCCVFFFFFFCLGGGGGGGGVTRMSRTSQKCFAIRVRKEELFLVIKKRIHSLTRCKGREQEEKEN